MARDNTAEAERLADIMNQNRNPSQETIRPIDLIDNNPIASSSAPDPNPIAVQITGLGLITNDTYDESSQNVLNQIKHFFDWAKDSSAAKELLKVGLYATLRSRLQKLAWINNEKYEKLIENPEVKNLIDEFIKLESEIYKTKPYEEVEEAANQEKDAWSDHSPSPKALSPVHENISQVMSPDMVNYAIDDQQMHDYRRELPPVIPEELVESKEYRKNIKENFEQSSNVDTSMAAGPSNLEFLDHYKVKTQSELKTPLKEELPKIEIDTGSGSDDSIEYLFPEKKISIEDVRSKMKGLFSDINKNRKGSPVTGSPNISQIGLQPTIESTQESAIANPSRSALFDAIKSKRKDSDIIESQTESSYAEDTSKIDTMIADIKGKGKAKEDMPLSEDLETPKSTFNKLFDVFKSKENKSQENLKPEIIPEELGIVEENTSSKRLSPLQTFASTSDQFASTESLFDEDEEDTIIETTTKNKDKQSEIKRKSFVDIEGTDKAKKIISETMDLDSEAVIKNLKAELPDIDYSNYKESFMKAVEEEINSGKTEKERDQIRKEYLAVDLDEIMKTGSTSDIKKLRNIINENYTHNSMLNEIKSKASKSSFIKESGDNPSTIETPIEAQSALSNVWDTLKSSLTPKIRTSDLQPELTALNEILDKGKAINTLDYLSEKDKEELGNLIKTTDPDTLIENLKGLPGSDYRDSLIRENVDHAIQLLQDANPNTSKQLLIEKLIQDNPLNKDQILDTVSKTMDEQFGIWEEKLTTKQLGKVKDFLTKEDLQEREILSESRTVDQIKTLKSVNKSHSNLLQELKTKASKSSFNTDTMNQFDSTESLFENEEEDIIETTTKHEDVTTHENVPEFLGKIDSDFKELKRKVSTNTLSEEIDWDSASAKVTLDSAYIYLGDTYRDCKSITLTTGDNMVITHNYNPQMEHNWDRDKAEFFEIKWRNDLYEKFGKYPDRLHSIIIEDKNGVNHQIYKTIGSREI